MNDKAPFLNCYKLLLRYGTILAAILEGSTRYISNQNKNWYKINCSSGHLSITCLAMLLLKLYFYLEKIIFTNHMPHSLNG